MMGWLLTVSCLASGTENSVVCCRLGLTPSPFYSDWSESQGITVRTSYMTFNSA